MVLCVILPDMEIEMGMLLAAGIGVGLASVSGVRAFLPLAVVAFFAVLGTFDLPASLEQAQSWAAVGGLLALALLESLLDKMKSFEPALDVLLTPVRAAVGAVLFTVAFAIAPEAGSVASVVPLLVAGGVIAGLVSILKAVFRPSAKVASTGVSVAFLSAGEDLVALAGAVVSMFVPFVAALPVVFLLFFFYRIRKRRGRKYGGLRILGD